jgi:hypothetical protein
MDRLVNPADVNKNDVIQQGNYLSKNDVSQGASYSQCNETLSSITLRQNKLECLYLRRINQPSII